MLPVPVSNFSLSYVPNKHGTQNGIQHSDNSAFLYSSKHEKIRFKNCIMTI